MVVQCYYVLPMMTYRDIDVEGEFELVHECAFQKKFIITENFYSVLLFVFILFFPTGKATVV